MSQSYQYFILCAFDVFGNWIFMLSASSLKTPIALWYLCTCERVYVWCMHSFNVCVCVCAFLHVVRTRLHTHSNTCVVFCFSVCMSLHVCVSFFFLFCCCSFLGKTTRELRVDSFKKRNAKSACVCMFVWWWSEPFLTLDMESQGGTPHRRKSLCVSCF